MKDELTRALLCDGAVSAIAISSTATVECARILHGCAPCAAAALGRTISAAVLMSASLKGNRDKLSLIIKGDGSAGQIISTVTRDGVIKGYIQNPEADLPLRFDGKLDVGGIVGKGRLTVIRDEGKHEPYVGVSELVSGEIAEDVAAYYANSEQLPAAVLLGVRFNSTGQVTSAGGMLITALPNCPESALLELENKLKGLPSFSELMEKYLCLEELLLDNFWDIGVQPLETVPIGYHCDCSSERMKQALVALGAKELNSLAEEPDDVEMCCQFCNAKYKFSNKEIMDLIGDSLDV